MSGAGDAAERPVGLTEDAGWEIGVSRTVPYPVDAVWRVLTSDVGLAAWLGAGATIVAEPGTPYRTDDGTIGELRSFRPLDRVRLTWHPPGWDHESTVQVTVSRPPSSRAGAERTVLRFHQERLASQAEREQQRVHWQAAVDRLVDLLAVSA